jgi:hypothetical protein
LSNHGIVSKIDGIESRNISRSRSNKPYGWGIIGPIEYGTGYGTRKRNGGCLRTIANGLIRYRRYRWVRINRNGKLIHSTITTNAIARKNRCNINGSNYRKHGSIGSIKRSDIPGS